MYKFLLLMSIVSALKRYHKYASLLNYLTIKIKVSPAMKESINDYAFKELLRYIVIYKTFTYAAFKLEK